MADPPRRVKYVYGQVLSAADLAAEQEYHRDMRYRHNRLHGSGTVSGLDVTLGDGCVHVSPGMAVDALGREIVVGEPLTLCLETHVEARQQDGDLVITWHEEPDSPVPGLDDDTPVFTRWSEQPQVRLVAHGEAGPEDLTLARLTTSRHGDVEVDTSVRRLLGRD